MSLRACPDLDPSAFIHPQDEAAQRALRAVPGVEAASRWISGRIDEAEIRRALAQGDQTSGPARARVEARYREAAAALGVDQPPALVQIEHSGVNAAALGLSPPVVVITTGCGALSDAALRMILGHELAHVLCRHMEFKMMAIRARALGGWAALMAGPLIVGGLSLVGLSAAVALWDRRSELTADRGGLLAAQDDTAPREVFEAVQASPAVEALASLPSGLRAVLNVMNTHPDLPDRLTALQGWVESGAYDRLLAGEYARRSLDGRVANTSEYGAHLDALAEIAALERTMDAGPSAAELEAIALKELEDL